MDMVAFVVDNAAFDTLSYCFVWVVCHGVMAETVVASKPHRNITSSSMAHQKDCNSVNMRCIMIPDIASFVADNSPNDTVSYCFVWVVCHGVMAEAVNAIKSHWNITSSVMAHKKDCNSVNMRCIKIMDIDSFVADNALNNTISLCFDPVCNGQLLAKNWMNAKITKKWENLPIKYGVLAHPGGVCEVWKQVGK